MLSTFGRGGGMIYIMIYMGDVQSIRRYDYIGGSSVHHRDTNTYKGEITHIYQEIPTSIYIQHIRIRDVSIFSITLRACFVCISIYFDKELLQMMNILCHVITCLNLTLSSKTEIFCPESEGRSGRRPLLPKKRLNILVNLTLEKSYHSVITFSMLRKLSAFRFQFILHRK